MIFQTIFYHTQGEISRCGYKKPDYFNIHITKTTNITIFNFVLDGGGHYWFIIMSDKVGEIRQKADCRKGGKT